MPTHPSLYIIGGLTLVLVVLIFFGWGQSKAKINAATPQQSNEGKTKNHPLIDGLQDVFRNESQFITDEMKRIQNIIADAITALELAFTNISTLSSEQQKEVEQLVGALNQNDISEKENDDIKVLISDAEKLLALMDETLLADVQRNANALTGTQNDVILKIKTHTENVLQALSAFNSQIHTTLQKLNWTSAEIERHVHQAVSSLQFEDIARQSTQQVCAEQDLVRDAVQKLKQSPDLDPYEFIHDLIQNVKLLQSDRHRVVTEQTDMKDNTVELFQ